MNPLAPAQDNASRSPSILGRCILTLSVLFPISLSAQQLATFDPSALPNEEFAAVACPPAPPSAWTAHLVSGPTAGTWWAGATAADNANQRLYYTTGIPADGILRTPFGSIGTGAAPTIGPT